MVVVNTDWRSANHGARRGVDGPDMIVLHYTAMESAEAALARLCDPAAEVSAHYLVDRDGTVYGLVDEDRRAWHAGVGQWGETSDVNSASIGIELVNAGSLRGMPPFAEAQMGAVESLITLIQDRWVVPLHRVVGHSDTALGRKPDPGPKFDWVRLARAGLAMGWDGTLGDMDFDTALDALGYGPAERDVRLDAFRLRWRQHALGRPIEAADRTLAAGLVEELTAKGIADS